MTIIAFPFAGGNVFSYNFLKPINLEGFTLKVIEYPGRGFRQNESLKYDINEVVQDCLAQIRPIIEKEDYIFFGHSMGGLVSYLLSHEIRKKGLRSPSRLIVCGKTAPSVKRKKFIANLPDQIFWEHIAHKGGMNKRTVENADFSAFHIPILKADLTAIENYKYEIVEKLNIPIDVFYGHEEGILEDEILRWEIESQKNVQIKQLKGNHFFLFDYPLLFIDHLKTLFKTSTVHLRN